MPQIKIITRICRGCGRSETGRSRDLVKKYCSRDCWIAYGAGVHLRTGDSADCAQCGNLFYMRGSYIKQGRKYCSLACYVTATAAPPQLQICKQCSAEFTPKRNKIQPFCSYRCSKLGINNPNWIGELNLKPQRKPSSRVWRKAVYSRDNYQCQACGAKHKRLQPRHLDAYHWCVERRDDVTNGVTLCIDCHKEFHKTYGSTLNTEQQWIEFINFRLAQHWTISGPRASAA